MSRGYMGKLVEVDLSLSKVEERKLDEQLRRDFIGCCGLGARLLWEAMRPGSEALGPENVLGFLTGPFTGTNALNGSRFSVVCKSPLTGTWGDANCGGNFGPHLKFSGFDGILLRGIAEHPLYIFIDNGRVELRDASPLWGLSCPDTEERLKAALGSDIEAVYIGPAGEKLSLISCIITDRGRALGRSGVGAVMGSKRLKAIAVRGKARVPVADEDKIMSLRRRYLRQRGAFYHVLHPYGTVGTLHGSTISGDSPIKNWAGVAQVDFAGVGDKFQDESISKYEKKKYACWHCVIACGGFMEVSEGPYAGTRSHKVEYESGSAFGPLCLNDDFPSIIKAHDLCNHYGLDVISAGSAIAFAMECYEKGILSQEDCGGLDLSWGDHRAMIRLLEQMGRRQGLGDLLADGVRVAARKIGRGAEALAMHIQGQELPMHDPRFQPGLATTYKMDASPGRHTRGSPLIAPPLGWDVEVEPKYQYSSKGETQRKLIALTNMVDASGACLFYSLSYPITYLPDFLTAITGWEYTLEDCYTCGERMAQIRHAFNLREGLNPLEFRIPDRVIGHPPLTAGNLRGVTIDLDAQVKDLCQAMDWDQVTCKPSAERLERLGLGFLLPDL